MNPIPFERASRLLLLPLCGAIVFCPPLSATLEAQALARWDLTGHESHTPAEATVTVARESSGRIEVNGEVVFQGLLSDVEMIPVTGSTSSAGTNLHPPRPAWYLHVPITDPSILVTGENQILLTIFSGQIPLLVELQLAVFDTE